LSIFEKLELRDTDIGKLLKDNNQWFEALFDLMCTSDSVRLLFLSNLDMIQRKEEPPRPTVTEIEGILMREGTTEQSKAEKIAKEIAKTISVSIAERRVVSIRSGNFGLIEPFDMSKIKLENSIPSLGHVYGSYFSNLVSVLETVGDFGKTITPADLLNAYRECERAGVMTSLEKIFLCKRCGFFKCEENTSSLDTCPHEKIRLELFQLKSGILEAWKRGVILCGYFAHALKQDKWKTLTEVEVQSTGDMWHQIDVIAEKEDSVLLCECKQLHPANVLSKEEVMKALGILEDLEKTVQEKFPKKEIRKAIVTTGVFAKEIRGIRARKDMLLIDRNDIIMEPKSWRERIWRG